MRDVRYANAGVKIWDKFRAYHLKHEVTWNIRVDDRKVKERYAISKVQYENA